MAIEVIKSRVAKEDIKFGTSSFTRQTGPTQYQQCSEVYAAHVPIRDSGGLFTAANVEVALAEIMTIVNLVNLRIVALTA